MTRVSITLDKVDANQMSAVSKKLLADINECAVAISEVKSHAENMVRYSEAYSVELSALQERFELLLRRGLFRDNREITSKLQRFVDRINRMRELRNQSEPGAFMIEVNGVMEIAWRELP